MMPNNTFPRPLVSYILYIGDKSPIKKLLKFEVVEGSAVNNHKTNQVKKCSSPKKLKKRDYKSFMNHPIPIEVSLNDGHSSQHLPKSLHRLKTLFWGEKYTADKSRVKLLDFAVERKLLSTITKQITSTINLNSTKKITR